VASSDSEIRADVIFVSEFLRASFQFHYRDPTLLSAMIQSVHSSFQIKFKDRLAWIDAASTVAVLLDDLNFISNELASLYTPNAEHCGIPRCACSRLILLADGFLRSWLLLPSSADGRVARNSASASQQPARADQSQSQQQLA